MPIGLGSKAIAGRVRAYIQAAEKGQAVDAIR